MFDPILNSQERLNKLLVEDVTEMRKKLKMGHTKSEEFPFKQYYKRHIKNERFTNEELAELSQFLEDKRTVGIVGINIDEIIDFAKETNAKYIVGIDLGKEDGLIRQEGERVIIDNMKLIEFLRSRNENEFDTIIFMDILRHHTIEHNYRILSEVKRILTPAGDILIREDESDDLLRRDPQAIHKLPATITKFMLDNLKFNSYPYKTTHLTKKSTQYVKTAKKT